MLSLNFVLFSAIAALVSASPAATANTTAPGEAKQLAPPFEINIEFNSATGNEVAWIAGQSKCNNVVLGPVSDLLLPCMRENTHLISLQPCRATPTGAAVASP